MDKVDELIDAVGMEVAKQSSFREVYFRLDKKLKDALAVKNAIHDECKRLKKEKYKEAVAWGCKYHDLNRKYENNVRHLNLSKKHYSEVIVQIASLVSEFKETSDACDSYEALILELLNESGCVDKLLRTNLCE